MIRRICLTLLMALIFWNGFTQTVNNLTLQACHQSAIEKYPLGDKSALLSAQNEIHLEKTKADRLPTINWTGRASLQTENIEFPFENPGFPKLNLPLFNARTAIEAQYTIYDGGISNLQNATRTSELLANQQAVTVELDQLKAQINQFYFGIIMLRQKIVVLENSQENLHTKIESMEAGVRHGVVLESDLKKMRVEALRLEATIEETQGEIKSLIAGLNNMTGLEADENTQLEVPNLTPVVANNELQRPELELFRLQKEQILTQEALISARQKPKLGAFFEGGFGYPNPLNLFEVAFRPYALGGIQFSWNLFDWKQSDRDRQLLSLQSQLVDNQRAVFEKNISTMEDQFFENEKKIRRQIERDQEIAQLQKEILDQLSAQLDRGVITTTEYLDQVHAEKQAQLDLQTHQLQLQQINVEYLTLKGLL